MIGSLKLNVLPCWVAVAVCLSLTSCAIVPPTGSPTPQYLLRDALTSRVADLEARAELGEARAQFELSILYQYGLRMKSFDPQLASQWRTRALNGRSNMPITQYISGINGKPGRTAIINVPKSDLSGAEVAAADMCAARLRTGVPDLQGTDACGGPGPFMELSQLWARARMGM